MSLFDFLKKKPKNDGTVDVSPQTAADAGRLAELALKSIQDGVIIVNKDGFIKFINPAAVNMTGIEKAENALNLEFPLVLKLEYLDGTKVDSSNNKLEAASKANQQFDSKEYVIIGTLNDKKTPARIVLTPTGGAGSDRIITFRDIAKELEEEGAQAEFISTASHEMRTPVASIEGYLSLALNPQTATLDARAKQYIESAHEASKRLGNLFKDLLDVTKIDDKRVRTRMVPVELTSYVKKIVNEYLPKFKEKNITYTFGAEGDGKEKGSGLGVKKINQLVYCSVDLDFLGEILGNLVENAIKYTPVGGAVWVNVRGDGDKALINVTDTGIGIASDDLQHIFQKFYRADNSQTRTVGGTGLGLYLVKQRVEIMDGRVWAESSFGEGSTFYVSFPRLSEEEYKRRVMAMNNQKTVQMFAEKPLVENVASNAERALNNLLPQQEIVSENGGQMVAQAGPTGAGVQTQNDLTSGATNNTSGVQSAGFGAVTQQTQMNIQGVQYPVYQNRAMGPQNRGYQMQISPQNQPNQQQMQQQAFGRQQRQAIQMQRTPQNVMQQGQFFRQQNQAVQPAQFQQQGEYTQQTSVQPQATFQQNPIQNQ